MSENRKPPGWGDGPSDEDVPDEGPTEPVDDLAELRSRQARRNLEKALDDIDEAEDSPALQMEEGFDQYLCGELEKAVPLWLAAVEGNAAIVVRLLSWNDPGVFARLDARRLNEAWACIDEDWWTFYATDYDAWVALLSFWCRPAVQRLVGAEAFGVLAEWRGGPPEAKAIAREVQEDLEGEGAAWDLRGEIGWELYRIAGFFGKLDKEGRRPDELPQEPCAELRRIQASLQKRAIELALEGPTEDAALDEHEALMETGQAVHRLIEELRGALPPLPPRVLPETASLDGLCPCGSGRKFRECCGVRGG